MAEPENLQQKNRVIYNVQDLFFGLVSGEQNEPLVTGTNGEEIEVLKRIHKVQGVSYDFQVQREDVGVLGRASFEDNIITRPPDINLSITYSLEGFNNESKMGFNVLSLDSSSIPSKEFTSPFLEGNKQQNVYIAVNQDESDIRETPRHPDEIAPLIASGRYQELEHSNTSGMGMIVFQNCRATNYAVDVSLGSFPKADVSFVSDNAIYLNSAKDQYVPWLNEQTAKTYYKQNNKDTNQEFMVPRHYLRQNPYFDPNYTFKPGDAHVTIETRPTPEDTLINYDFEDGAVLASGGATPNAVENDPNLSYAGSRSLRIDGSAQGGGVRVDLLKNEKGEPVSMTVGEYYTLDVRIKTNIVHPNQMVVNFAARNSMTSSDSNLSTFQLIRLQDGWVQVKKRVKLDRVNNYLYIYTNSAHLNGKSLWIDNIVLSKDSENPPLKFHSDLLQSFQLSVPLSRENVSCVGYKYYIDRTVTLPVKTTFSIGMASQDKEFPVSVEGEDRQGNFLDNLTKDQEYDVYVSFIDEQAREGMKYRIFGAKFEGVSYGLDVGSPKSHDLNFSISNDYDFGRDIISAEGRGLFVLDFLVNDDLIPLTDDEGNVFADPFPFNF